MKSKYIVTSFDKPVATYDDYFLAEKAAMATENGKVVTVGHNLHTDLLGDGVYVWGLFWHTDVAKFDEVEIVNIDEWETVLKDPPDLYDWGFGCFIKAKNGGEAMKLAAVEYAHIVDKYIKEENV